MKVKKQTPKPCMKRGIDNDQFLIACELKEYCESCNHYNNPKSGVFNLCLNVEKYLVENNLIRYELREVSGLEVLFDGVEKVHNLNSEINRYEYFEGAGASDSLQFSYNIEENIDWSFTEAKEFFSTEGLIQNSNDLESSLFNYNPERLGYAQSFGNDILSLSPESLFESVLIFIYQRGDFEPQFIEIKEESQSEKRNRELRDDDLYTVATLMLHGLEYESKTALKRLWPRYTAKRLETLKLEVIKKVNRAMIKSFRKFNKIWNILNEKQTEAFLLEYFYEGDEKPTQKENAKRIGIAVSSYKDRLETALKKLCKLYSEYPRLKRRKKKEPAKAAVKEKKLSLAEKDKLKRWAREKMDDYLDSVRIAESYSVYSKDTAEEKIDGLFDKKTTLNTYKYDI